MTSPATPRTILGTDYILEALAAEGLGHLFMVPGGLVDPFLPALARQRKLTPVIAAHEGGAVYMADGYARASGRFGAALGIGGPGCCNMATAVAAAKTDGSPVLVMTGEVPLDLEDRGTFQDASQATLDDTAVMAPLTRLSKTVASAKNLNHWFRHALTAMWAQPRGPVHLSLTHDALIGEGAADYVAVSGFFAHAWRLSMEAAETALRLLADQAGAKSRIAILAGAGVEHDAAAARLQEIAERWSIPVATTLRAKGVFPEDHALSLGVFGYAGTRHATAAILGGDIDCLLVLGSGFNERDTMHWTVRERSKAFMIHVNTDMEELTANGDLGHVVPGSAHAFLDLMHERAAALAPTLAAGEARRREWLSAIKAQPRLHDVENLSRSTSPIHPAAAIAALRRRSRATASSSSIPARTAPSPGTTGAPTRREPTSPPPISDRWAGRYRRLSACNARGRIAASPSSPATAACRCTASRCRPRRATGCRSSTWSSTIPRSATSGCARGNTARCRRSSPAFPITIGRDLRALSGRKASPCAIRRSSRAHSKRRSPRTPPRSSTSRPTRIV
jgi:thiamine pyrophosphate-dependent acetolactate synthase large subunit-like protein